MDGEVVHDGVTGQAIVASTGTPVDTILEALQSGGTRDDVLRAHPGLTGDDITAAVQFARVAVQRGVRYPVGDEMPRAGGFAVHETAAPYNAAVTAGAALRIAQRKRRQLAYDVGLIDSICEGLRQLEAGKGIPQDEVAAHLRARFPG